MAKDFFEKAAEDIADAKKKGWNLLIPSIPLNKPDSGLFIPVLETLTISTEKAAKEVYPADENYRLHATALNKIAIAGSIKWDSRSSGFTRAQDKKNVAFRAVGGVMMADGDMHVEAGYYDVDLDEVLDRLTEEYQAKAKKNKKDQAYVDYCVSRDFRAKRQHMLKMAETGAKNRVIRSIFHVKSEYSSAELSKPFLVLRYKLHLDTQNQEIRRMIAQAQVMAALGIYGPSPNAGLLAGPQPLDVEFSPIDPMSDPNLNGFVPDPDAPPEAEQDMSMSGMKADFLALDKDRQMEMLRDMAKAVSVDLTKLIKDHSDWKRSDFFEHLEPLQASPQQEDDIPF